MSTRGKQILWLLIPMVLGIVLYVSWYQTQEAYTDEYGRPAMRYADENSLWKQMDLAVFRALNGSMRDNRPMQIFWGLTNHRACDLVAALWMIAIFLGYYLTNPRKEERAALLQFALYMSAMTLIAISFSSAKIGMDFRRWSPSLTPGVMEQAVLLSELEHITWNAKDSSTGSFPGDHGVVLLMVGSAMLYRLRSLPARAATLFGILFFSLPRMAGGGHWASDLLAGSMIYYALLFPLFMFAPIRERGIRLLRQPAAWINRLLAVILRQDPSAW